MELARAVCPKDSNLKVRCPDLQKMVWINPASVIEFAVVHDLEGNSAWELKSSLTFSQKLDVGKAQMGWKKLKTISVNVEAILANPALFSDA